MKTKQLQLQTGHCIRQIRKERQFSQKELSRFTQIAQSDISKLERGLTNPTIQTLNQIARCLNCELVIEFKSSKKTK